MFNKANADVLYMRGRFEEAAQMYLDGAAEGDVGAAFNYGYCLLHGKGVDYNPTEAKSYFAYARDMEGGEACYSLAMLYIHGEGVKKDYAKALEYMKISAEQGCVEAQLYLGMAYTTGYMLEPEIRGICMIPFHKPEYAVPSDLLLDGYVEDAESDEELRFSTVSADARSAFEWFRKAAHADPTYVGELVAKGQFLYAKCYIDGMGTEFNRTKGERLMLAAGKSGSREAVAFISENGIDPTRVLAEAKAERRKRSGGV